MKASEIKVGGHYTAKVSNHLTTVRVDSIRESSALGSMVYNVTNIRTGRTTSFYSSRKFRKEVVLKADVHPVAGPNSKTVVDYRIQGAEQCSDPTLGAQDAAAELKVMSSDSVDGANSQVSYEDCAAAVDAGYGSDNPPEKLAGFANKIAVNPYTTFNSALAQKIAAARPIATASPHNLTEEQEAIIADDSQVLVIQAGAGSGKTFVCVEKSKVMPGKGQYTAFNSDLVSDSKGKFGSNVSCNTIHSLGFQAFGKRFAHRLEASRKRVMGYELAAMLGLQDITITGLNGQPKIINAGVLASQVKRAVTNFCQSADNEIDTYHVPRFDGIDAEHSRSNSDFVKASLLPYAQKLWADKCNPLGQLPFTHDDYIKMWEMADPIIGADYVLLDEAQDTSPVMLSIMEQQAKRGTRIILVGDSQQQIYSWRGAIDALAAFPDAPRLYLSKSFRFGQVVAEVANAVLKHLSEPTKLIMKGFEKINSRLDTLKKPNAILCRTNAGAIQYLMEGIAKGDNPCLIGKIDDICGFVRAAGSLQQGKSTNHMELCCFKNWREVQEYSKTDDGQELRLMTKIIDTFKVDRLLKALTNMPAEKDAGVVVGTAHKSKGREWKKVKLGSDFQPLDKMGDEECRLLYVAATRAQEVLDVETCPPFCGGERRANDGWNGEGGELRTVDISKARELSDGLPKPEDTEGDDAYYSCPECGKVNHGTPRLAGSCDECQSKWKDDPKEEPKAEPVPEQKRMVFDFNTWSKGRDGNWLVRGKPGQTGEIEIVRKDNSKSKKTIKKVVWQDAETALYEVV